jgi:5-(carboxyamino)imidazole ribonucleotide synthase
MKMQTEVITLGNGQLGLMLGKAAKKLGIPFSAFSLSDAWSWIRSRTDVTNVLVTFEQEHVDELLLQEFETKGVKAFPGWESFSILKSKFSQKVFLQKNAFPTSPFISCKPLSPDCSRFLASNQGGVLKSGRGGYDGKGVWIINASGQTKDGSYENVLLNLEQPYIEKRIAFDFELAAVVCRSANGEIELYPTVKSQQQDGICFQVEYTQEFAKSKLAQDAGKIATDLAHALDYVGVLAVEFFAKDGNLFVNEIAPRVHNSGHFTIDVCEGSQFENHLLAGLGMPLRKALPSHPAALMVNLLWPPQVQDFASLYTRLTCGPDWPENAKLHWYGKSEARPRRKMGHFTIYGSDIETCKREAEQILASRWA